MTFDGDEIFACPYCKHIYKDHIVASYNTSNVDSYSDGHIEGIVPNFISVIKCQQEDCNKFFHIDKAEKLGEMLKNEDITNYHEEWQNATPLYEYRIGADELEECLHTEFCKNPDNEIIVRTLLLRRYNDAIRKDRNHQIAQEDKPALINNIEKLIELSGDAELVAEKIHLAELYREKGDFESCIKILDSIDTENQNERIFKEKIYSQAKVKDDKVFNIHLPAIKKEFQCNSCGHSLILFDLDKLSSSLDYRHYKCLNDNIVFNAPSKVFNTERYYQLTFLQKLFKIKKPYEHIIAKDKITCPKCKESNTEFFYPEEHICIKCENGKYEEVPWF